MENEIKQTISESIEAIKKIENISEDIEKAIIIMEKCIRKGNKIILFGNGGSAADAQHIAAELIGKLNKHRKSYPAIALTTDTSIISAISNDYSFEKIFSRQCESLVKQGDVILGISTSGNSKNVINGIKISKKNGGIAIGLLGNKGGRIKSLVDHSIIVHSFSTQRIQEVHRIIYHIICEQLEEKLSKSTK